MGEPPQEWAGSFNVQASLLVEDRPAGDGEQLPSEREARHRFLERLPTRLCRTDGSAGRGPGLGRDQVADRGAAGPSGPGHGPAGDGRPGARDAHLVLGPHKGTCSSTTSACV
jgi:hypothetical protein